MNNVELAKKIEGYLKSSASKAKKFEDLVAVTVSLISENNEDLYVEVKDGKISVAPYSYNDYGCAVEASAESIDKIFSGAVSFDKALSDGLVRVCGGDVAKFKALEVLVPAKKAPAKKTTAKAETAKKTTTKAAKAPAKKAAPAKAETKAETKTEAKAEVKAEAVKAETVKADAPVEKAAEKAPAKRCCKKKQ